MIDKQIAEMAKQAGDDWDHTLQSDKEFLQRFAQLVRNEVLDECANACQNWGNPSSIVYLGSACRAAASRITGMKS